ncbi:MAG: hypothetical protein H6715_01905 [Myxococcales bacterium]|nr:hypothetical protein [Myxococcales bacterium]
MAKIIGLPKLSPTMDEGTLVRWVKNEGDAVEIDELLAEVKPTKPPWSFVRLIMTYWQTARGRGSSAQTR